MQEESPFSKGMSKFRTVQSLMEGTSMRMKDNSFRIDRPGILQQYVQQRQKQKQLLWNLSLSQERKIQLFGQSERVATTKLTNKQLIIEDHPIKGKQVMTIDNWELKKNKFENSQSQISEIPIKNNQKDYQIIQSDNIFATPQELDLKDQVIKTKPNKLNHISEDSLFEQNKQ